jgi:hypothetical protein
LIEDRSLLIFGQINRQPVDSAPRPKSFDRQSAINSSTMSTPRELLDRLETRHDELIEKLDNLNAQIEKALAEIFKNRAATTREAALATATVPATDAAARRAA